MYALSGIKLFRNMLPEHKDLKGRCATRKRQMLARTCSSGDFLFWDSLFGYN